MNFYHAFYFLLILQGVREMTGFCEAILSWLPSLRKAAESVPVMTWESFIEEARTQVNPLAGYDHFNLLLTQLQQMGEVALIILNKMIKII